MRKMFKAMFALPTALWLLAAGASTAGAQQQVAAEFPVPLRLEATLQTFECSNNPGPRIEFEGQVLFTSGTSVGLIFRNQREAPAPHEYIENVVVTPIIAVDQAITIPKQPVQGGVGGNPWISIQILDGALRPLTGEILLGRCVQGAVPGTNFQALIDAVANVAVTDCTNNPGPFIELDGGVSFADGLKARIIFRNQREPGGPHENTSTSDITIVPAAFTVRFPKQPVQGGVGGNPWISVQFMNGTQPVGTETLLGRCVQLLPGN
jgi:hypothetical protein